MKRLLLAVLTIVLLCGNTIAQETTTNSDYNTWQVRLRLLTVVPSEGADIGVIGGDVEISKSVVPELDFTYFFNKNLALELILGTTPHDVNTIHSDISAVVSGATDAEVDLGSVWLLPPTLTLQYHFNGEKVHPYVGAGINYTLFYGIDEGNVVADVEYDNAIGFAFQTGLDYDINEKWFINLDAKYILLNTDVTVDASNLTSDASLQSVLRAIPAEVDINPFLASIGVGMRF